MVREALRRALTRAASITIPSVRRTDLEATLHYEEGSTYDFTFTDGTSRRLRYEGFDKDMKTLWRDVGTDEVIKLLPTVQSHTRVH